MITLSRSTLWAPALLASSSLVLTACGSKEDEVPGGMGGEGVASGGSPSGSGASSGLGTGGSNASSGGSASGGSASGGLSAGTGGVPDGCVVDLDCDPPDLPSTGDFAQDCVDRINQFRVGCHCLPALARWTDGEACAEANAVYDKGTGQAHSGWRPNEGMPGACEEDSGPLSPEYYGWATNECPGWDSEEQVVSGCMKMMYREGADWAVVLGRAPTQDDYASCDNTCYGKYGHFIAMTNESNTHVACGITAEAKFWSVQNYE